MVAATIGAVKTTATDIVSTGKILAVIAGICAIMMAFSQASNILMGAMLPL